MNLAWWLDHSAQEYGDGIASIDLDGTQYTYSELHDLASRFATVLRDQADVAEDAVLVSLAPESGIHLALMYGTMQLGGIFSALNPELLPDRLAQQILTVGARVLVADPKYVSLATELANRAGADTRIFVLGPNKDGLANLLALAASAEPEHRVHPRRNTDVAAINFTAGTAGHSKGVSMTHGTFAVSAQGAMFTRGLGRSTVNLSVIGIYHSGGLNDAVKFVMCGGTIIWAGGWNAERVIALILQYRPNWIFFIVPTMLRDLMRQPEWETLPLEGMSINVAGEPVPTEVALALEAKGVRFANAYGMTETMPFGITSPSFAASDAQDEAPLGSSGKPSIEFCELVLKDPLTGAVIDEAGIDGEVCVRGEVVTPGYYHDPERTAEAFDADGYLHTKDVAHRDADGWYFLSGRTDDLINSGGEKLSLIEIDNLLLSHSEVVDAATVGVAHTRFGEVPAAFIVMQGHGSRDQEEDLRLLDNYMIASTERWKRPRLYVFVSEIPRTPAKRTKSYPELRSMIEGIVVSDEDGVIALGAEAITKGPRR